MSTSRTSDHERLVVNALRCTACRLCLSRKNVVVARGPTSALLMLVGEAPGEFEDKQGRPFVGPSGVLLDRLLLRAEIPINDIYVCNAVKCRPPANRDPSPDELQSCRSWLQQQVRLVRPRMILTSGRVATTAVTATYGPMEVLLSHQKMFCHFCDEPIPVIPLYHLAYLLRRLHDKTSGPVFADTVARLRRAWVTANTASAVEEAETHVFG